LRPLGPASWRLAWLALLAGALAALPACGPTRPAATVTPAAAPDSPQTLQAELSALPPGSAEAGRAEFSAAGCVACHSLQQDVRIVDPSLAGVASRAASRKPGYSAQLYLYESITRPNAYVVSGFSSGLMPPDFRSRLRPQDLSDLISFLLTES